MKITEICESTTAGAIATVAAPMNGGPLKRSGVGKGVYGNKKVGNLLTGQKTRAPFANSVKESRQIEEAHLEEDDLIIVPGQGHKLKSGFIPHSEDRRDHEVEMARSDLYQAHKNSSKIHKLIKNVSEDEGLEGWVQAKITKAADYLKSVREYLEGKHVQETGGVIAGGIAAESKKG